MQELILGRTNKGDLFTLPLDLVARKLGLIGVSGCGKSSGLAVIQEQMSKAMLSWCSVDAVGVGWGIRAMANGQPSPYNNVIIIGGKHQDIPIQSAPGFGRVVGEAIATSKVCAVIDLSRLMKEAAYQFVAEFFDTLMQHELTEPRHIFIEETPEYAPQQVAFKGQDHAKAEVQRFVTLGRNNGYGATLLAQRPAIIDKTCLAQCENLIVMRTTFRSDREILRKWLEEKAAKEDLDEIFKSLSSLDDGEAYFLSPQWLKKFVRFRFDRRVTFHPGETRQVGVKAQHVELADVNAFVDTLSKQLSKISAAVKLKDISNEVRPEGRKTSGKLILKSTEPRAEPRQEGKITKLQGEIVDLEVDKHNLQEEIKMKDARISELESQLSAAREVLKPKYEELKKLQAVFGEVQQSSTSSSVGGGFNMSKYAPFLEAAGKYGAKGMLEILMQHRELAPTQLKTLAKVGKNTYKTARAWMKRNHLADFPRGPKGKVTLLPL